MHRIWRQWQERAIVAALVAACLILAYLQYRWTGELSQAESQRLYASAGDRLAQFTRAFDTELRQAVQELIPNDDEVRTLGPERANKERLKRAIQTQDRRLFRRIGAAVIGMPGHLDYLDADLTTQKFAPAKWPESPDWQALRFRLEGMARGDSRRGEIVDPDTALIEVPVFVDDSEREWIVMELDTSYVRDKWLPELAATYLNPGGSQSFLVTVRGRSNPNIHIFGDPTGEPDAVATLFPVRYRGPDGGERRGPEGRERRGPGGREERGRWEVAVSHAAGSVPAAVQAIRVRNLGVALSLLALIAAAGAELLRLTRQTRRLAAAQCEFFAGLSHELRTPLTVIQGAGHNLLTGVVKDDAQRESYARAIVKQSAHLNEMVEQLLTHAAAQNEPIPAAGSTQLDVAVTEAIETAALELERTHRSVDVDMPPDLPAVQGDLPTLRRVLGNLILNAVRHGDGEINVTAAQAGAFVEVRVADNGPGIAPEDLKQVFDPFFRGHRARTGQSRGTGLGLSLVRETVEKLGGTVTVESEPGKGAAFTVRLPVAR